MSPLPRLLHHGSRAAQTMLGSIDSSFTTVREPVGTPEGEREVIVGVVIVR
jgi:hypothetical protein